MKRLVMAVMKVPVSTNYPTILFLFVHNLSKNAWKQNKFSMSQEAEYTRVPQPLTFDIIFNDCPLECRLMQCNMPTKFKLKIIIIIIIIII